MRALGSKLEIFSQVANPLHAPAEAKAEAKAGRKNGKPPPQPGVPAREASETVGKLAGFPLGWRPLHEVAGCSQ